MSDSHQRSACQLVSLSACQRKDKNRNNIDICRDAQSCALAKLFPFIFAISMILLLLFAGCVPAKVPPQLDATPGPAVVITEQEYDAGAFKVRYPAGWRVISSAAGSPATVIFASPDDTAIMLFGVDAAEAPMPETDEQIRTETRQIMLENNVGVTAILNAPEAAWESFTPIFDQMVASVN